MVNTTYEFVPWEYIYSVAPQGDSSSVFSLMTSLSS